MGTQTFSSQLEGGEADDRVRQDHAAGARRSRARRWLIPLGAFVIGAATSAALGGVAYRAAATAPAPASALVAAAPPAAAVLPAAALPAVQPVTAGSRRAQSNGRGLQVVVPADRDYVSSSGIPVAGMAFARPHGPSVRTVRVELFVAGRLIESADFKVLASRFAGVLEVTSPIGPADAELRISDPSNPSRPSVVRSITVQAPPSVPHG